MIQKTYIGDTLGHFFIGEINERDGCVCCYMPGRYIPQIKASILSLDFVAKREGAHFLMHQGYTYHEALQILLCGTPAEKKKAGVRELVDDGHGQPIFYDVDTMKAYRDGEKAAANAYHPADFADGKSIDFERCPYRRDDYVAAWERGHAAEWERSMIHAEECAA